MGVGTRLQVFRGSKERTVGGLTKKDLMRNKHNKVVSRKAHARGKKLVSSGIGKWAKAVMKARGELNITGFRAVKKELNCTILRALTTIKASTRNLLKILQSS